jgi:hypothetical protein
MSVSVSCPSHSDRQGTTETAEGRGRGKVKEKGGNVRAEYLLRYFKRSGQGQRGEHEVEGLI